MPERFWIAEIQISDEMETKIRTRRFVTGDEVREACVPDAYDEAIAGGPGRKHDGGMPPAEDEFAEFETDEETFDAMMAEAEPVDLVGARPRTAVVIEQADGAIFTLTVPSGGLVWAGTSTSAFNGESVVHGPGKLPAHHRLPDPKVDPKAALAG